MNFARIGTARGVKQGGSIASSKHCATGGKTRALSQRCPTQTSSRPLRCSTTATGGDRPRPKDKQGKELPPVAPNRQAVLNLPLDAYKKYENQVEQGFVRAARILHRLHIFFQRFRPAVSIAGRAAWARSSRISRRGG